MAQRTSLVITPSAPARKWISLSQTIRKMGDRQPKISPKRTVTRFSRKLAERRPEGRAFFSLSCGRPRSAFQDIGRRTSAISTPSPSSTTKSSMAANHKIRSESLLRTQRLPGARAAAAILPTRDKSKREEPATTKSSGGAASIMFFENAVREAVARIAVQAEFVARNIVQQNGSPIRVSALDP